jgi:glyoxylate reductase
MQTRPRIFVTHAIPAPARELLTAASELQVRSEDDPMKPDALAAFCAEQQIEGLLVIGGRVTEEVAQKGKSLRVISSASVGYDHIDVAACTARGIPVATAAGTLEETTADLAFALILASARRVAEADRYVREGRWKRWEWELLWGADVYGKTLGLVGFGNIGQAVARRAAGFSMRVLYTSLRRVTEAEGPKGPQWTALDDLLRDSDFVSLHVPLTRETERLIGPRELSLMKRTAFLINTSRGRVVDESALVAALQEGRLAGAGLDVFEREPAVPAELIATNRAVLLPHIGSATAETRTRMARRAAENLLALLDGRRATNVVNPEVLIR